MTKESVSLYLVPHQSQSICFIQLRQARHESFCITPSLGHKPSQQLIPQFLCFTLTLTTNMGITFSRLWERMVRTFISSEECQRRTLSESAWTGPAAVFCIPGSRKSPMEFHVLKSQSPSCIDRTTNSSFTLVSTLFFSAYLDDDRSLGRRKCVFSWLASTLRVKPPFSTS